MWLMSHRGRPKSWQMMEQNLTLIIFLSQHIRCFIIPFMLLGIKGKIKNHLTNISFILQKVHINIINLLGLLQQGKSISMILILINYPVSFSQMESEILTKNLLLLSPSKGYGIDKKTYYDPRYRIKTTPHFQNNSFWDFV